MQDRRIPSTPRADDHPTARRLAELQTARLLRRVCDAARERRWGIVQGLLAEARQRYASHAALQELLGHFERLARARDAKRVAREARSSSERLRASLAH